MTTSKQTGYIAGETCPACKRAELELHDDTHVVCPRCGKYQHKRVRK